MGHDTLRTSVPQIDDELAESLRVLAELETRLPAIRTQASKVQLVYDSGRRKVRAGGIAKQCAFLMLVIIGGFCIR